MNEKVFIVNCIKLKNLSYRQFINIKETILRKRNLIWNVTYFFVEDIQCWWLDIEFISRLVGQDFFILFHK